MSGTATGFHLILTVGHHWKNRTQLFHDTEMQSLSLDMKKFDLVNMLTVVGRLDV